MMLVMLVMVDKEKEEIVLESAGLGSQDVPFTW